MATKIDPLFRFLDAIGFVAVFLPFVIVFTLTYAFLEKTQVLGVEKGHARHKLNAMVAVIVGLLVVGSSNVLGVTTAIVQYIGLFAVIVLAVALLLGLFGVQHLPDNKWWNAIFFVVFMLLAVGVFHAMGWFGRGSDVFVAVFVIFFLLLFIIKIWLKKEPVVQNQVLQPATHHNHAPPTGAVGARPGEHARRAAPQKRPQEETSEEEAEDTGPIELHSPEEEAVVKDVLKRLRAAMAGREGRR